MSYFSSLNLFFSAFIYLMLLGYNLCASHVPRAQMDTPLFQPSCLGGGGFYACDWGTRFLGCCVNQTGEDACANGCLSSNLRAASFNAEYYSHITRNDCNASYIGEWYTCQSTTYPFLGCCRENPCAIDGCRQTDLIPAELSRDQTEKAPFLPVLVEHPKPSAKRRTVAIAGATTGGLLIAIILVLGLLWCRKSQRKRKQSVIQQSMYQSDFQGMPSKSPPSSHDTYPNLQTRIVVLPITCHRQHTLRAMKEASSTSFLGSPRL